MGWRWIPEAAVLAMHDEGLAAHGGSEGLRDEGLLSSALNRPRHHASYGTPSVFDLAAAYAFGIIRNHPFVDGNKRTGFLAAYVFLGLNGWNLIVPEPEVVAAVIALACGEMEEAGFAAWLQSQSAPLDGHK